MRYAVMIAIAFGTAAVAGAVASGAGANDYYTCESGYIWETSGDAAHCRKPPTVQTAALVACVAVNTPVGNIGTFEAIDKLTGGKDQCTGTNPVTGEVKFDRKCPDGFNYKVVSPGRDRCERTLPEEIRAPTRRVSR